MRKKSGPTPPSWMDRTGPVRSLLPARSGCALPTVAMLLALSAFGCQKEEAIISDDHQAMQQPKPVESAVADPSPGTGALESPPEEPIEPVIAKPRPKVTPKKPPTVPTHPPVLGGAPPPVIVPSPSPPSPKGGPVAVDPTT